MAHSFVVARPAVTPHGSGTTLLADVLAAAHVTPGEIAREQGLSRAVVYRAAQLQPGKAYGKSVRYETAAAIAAALDKPVAELFQHTVQL